MPPLNSILLRYCSIRNPSLLDPMDVNDFLLYHHLLIISPLHTYHFSTSHRSFVPLIHINQ